MKPRSRTLMFSLSLTTTALVAEVAGVGACGGELSHGHDHDHDGGHDGGHGHDHGGGDSIAITIWTDETELFVEFPPLVVGQESPFAAHLTMLDDFSAVDTGSVEVLLTGGGAAEERFDAMPSDTAGIFRPVATPTHAARRKVTLVLDNADGRWEHELGEYEVYASPDLVPHAEDEEEGDAISFLKEQQWKMPFSTALVTSQALRASIPAYARVGARADGEVTIVAPAKGRLLADAGQLPIVGAQVEAGDLLADFVPRLEAGADEPTLDLAVSAARLDLEHAKRERERLEKLLADGAVPERRVVEARHDEAAAKAALSAARRRSRQHRKVQRTGGKGKDASVEVRTPLSGTVFQVHAVAGALVEDGASLFRIVDTSTLWLAAHVPEVDQAKIPDVTGAWFTVPGIDGPIEVGNDAVVTRGGPIDDVTRTVTIVFSIPNPEGRLRVGTRVQAHLVMGEASPVTSVPTAAVLYDGVTPIVFVETGGESFERRMVQLGVRDGDRVEILDGVEVGERVVVEGAYAVELASTSTAPPAHGHPH